LKRAGHRITHAIFAVFHRGDRFAQMSSNFIESARESQLAYARTLRRDPVLD
jgi:hypothetical protein